MKKSFYAAMAFLFLSSGGVTSLIWSGDRPMLAQPGHMERKAHGADKPQMKPMGKMKHGMKMEMATEGIFEGVGTVIALQPRKSQVVVDHEEIKGFMAPMIMGYPVESNALLTGLKPGDRVKFKIDAATKKIVAIEHLKGEEADKYVRHVKKMPPRSALKPAEGASVKILSPENGQTVTGSEVNIRFRLIKGKLGSHVHAYVDEELAGMFSRDEETQIGQGSVIEIQPGRHTLVLRVVTENHVELDATDTVDFGVK